MEKVIEEGMINLICTMTIAKAKDTQGKVASSLLATQTGTKGLENPKESRWEEIWQIWLTTMTVETKRKGIMMGDSKS